MPNITAAKQPNLAAREKQRGVALVMFTIGMLAVIAVAGLALDGSHAMLNHSRLQNTVDAAALAAAKVLSDTSDTGLATVAARDVFTSNQGADGNSQMGTYTDAGNAIVEYSATQSPFAPGSLPADYVRVTYNDFTFPSWIIQVLNIDTKRVSASAVSGPSPTLGSACDVVPLIICGDPDAGGPFWGFNDNEVTMLKGAAGDDPTISQGNFQLARLGGSGANVVRDNLAGGYEGCVAGDTIPTQPGNAAAVAQGINTRFGIYRGAMSPADGYLPDVITQQQDGVLTMNGAGEIELDGEVVTDSSDLDFAYDVAGAYPSYTDRLDALNYDVAPPAGAFDRRNLPVIIADCTDAGGGAIDLPVLGVACYFMSQPMCLPGECPVGNDNNIFGEFVQECDALGGFGPDPTIEPGPFMIQLYDDPDRDAS